MNYCQCRLVKETQNGHEEKVTYIPELYAILDSVIQLKNKDNSWTDGWVVKSVGPVTVEKYVLDNERNYLKQRKSSDI